MVNKKCHFIFQTFQTQIKIRLYVFMYYFFINENKEFTYTMKQSCDIICR